jgi:two-component system, cell cycle response regulator
MDKDINSIEILENLYEGVYFVDKTRTITSWNNGAHQITGFSSDEVKHKKCYSNILNHVDINGVALCFDGCPLHATIQDGIAREANVFLQHKNGHRVPIMIKALPIYNNEGEIEGAVEIFTEIKEEKSIQSDLLKLQLEASQDTLTNVPNRKYLNAIIESKIREFKAVNVSFGINFIDIDNFKI